MSKSILIVVNKEGKMAMEIDGMTIIESLGNLELAKHQILVNQTKTLSMEKMKREDEKE